MFKKYVICEMVFRKSSHTFIFAIALVLFAIWMVGEDENDSVVRNSASAIVKRSFLQEEPQQQVSAPSRASANADKQRRPPVDTALVTESDGGEIEGWMDEDLASDDWAADFEQPVDFAGEDAPAQTVAQADVSTPPADESGDALEQDLQAAISKLDK